MEKLIFKSCQLEAIQFSDLTEEEVGTLANELAVVLPRKAIIGLYGEVGVGKSTFCRLLLYALGYRGLVSSPTYSCVETYSFSDRLVHHFDFYRFHCVEDVLTLGLEELFEEEAICLVEWPDLGACYWQSLYAELRFSAELNAPMQRRVTLRGKLLENLGTQWISKLREKLSIALCTKIAGKSSS